MGVLLANNASSILQAPIGTADTAITVLITDTAAFPSPVALNSDYFYATIEDRRAVPILREIVTVTAVNGAVFTVIRGQDGTTAQAFNPGAVVSARLNAQAVFDVAALPSAGVTAALISGGTLPVSGLSGTFSGPVAGTTAAFSAGLQATTGTFSGVISGAGYSGGPISGTTGAFSGGVTGTSFFTAGVVSGAAGLETTSLISAPIAQIGTLSLFNAGSGCVVVESALGASTPAIAVMNRFNAAGAVGMSVFNERTDGTAIAFIAGTSTIVGTIKNNGSTIAYNTTSDQRLKDDRGLMTADEAWWFIRKLRPRWFTWKHSPAATPQPGFFAQQMHKVYPWAVSKGHKKEPWGMDIAKLMTPVIAALQDAERRISHLEKEAKR